MSEPWRKDLRKQHPTFRRAIGADIRVTLAYRAEERPVRSKWQLLVQFVRLLWVADAFYALTCYRLKAALQRRRVPLLPRLLHKMAMRSAQVCIGDPVVIEPGIYIAHGQIVVDGFVKVATGVVFLPWVTIGLKAGNFQGPTIGPHVQIGTGSKILGPITVGEGASIGANAVVVHDVAPHTTVVGVPARPAGELSA